MAAVGGTPDGRWTWPTPPLDPNRAPRCFGLGAKIKNSASMQVHPAGEKREILSAPKGCVPNF
jgi:hypothetical protein